MMNQDQKITSYTSHVSEIILLAKDRNLRELQNLIDHKISIDERAVAHKINFINEKNIDCTLLLTPAAFLAMDGDFESANFLKNYCFANVDFIAYGAACGGHFDYVKILETHDHANTDYIAEGAAFNGNESYVKELIRENKVINFGRIARGYANGAHRSKAECMRTHYQNVVYWLASGAGLGGIQDYAEYLREFANAHVDWIAEGAACCGHTKYIDEILRPQGADLIKIANKAVYGGHFDYVASIEQDFYKTKDSSNYSLMLLASEGGHFAYADAVQFAADGLEIEGRFLLAIQGGHMSNAEHLFYIYDKWWIDNFDVRIEEFIKNDEKRTLLLLAQAKTEKFRKILFKNLSKGSAKNHFKDNRLLKKAKAIRDNITTYNISIDQAIYLYQEEGYALKGLVDFEIDFKFPKALNIIIFLYVFELSALPQKFLGDKICGLIGKDLYQNFSTSKNLKKIDDQYYLKLGLFSDNKSTKDKFIIDAKNIITTLPEEKSIAALPVSSRSHFFQLCSKSKTACYHRILFSLKSNTSKKFEEFANAAIKRAGSLHSKL